MDESTNNNGTSVKFFTWADWYPLWRIRFAQLAEAGIVLDQENIPVKPENVPLEDSEWDYHHMDDVYLRDAGGFWLARQGDVPIGHIGGQDLGGVVELRRMYVRAAYRCKGVGTTLVKALIEHCMCKGVKAIELWTIRDGEGCQLYNKMGFQKVSRPGPGFECVNRETGYTPGLDEIRMRLDFENPDA